MATDFADRLMGTVRRIEGNAVQSFEGFEGEEGRLRSRPPTNEGMIDLSRHNVADLFMRSASRFSGSLLMRLYAQL